MDLHDLCTELGALYVGLGAAVAPPPAESDRSTPVRAADWWCAVHRQGHRRAQWRAECAGGADPRFARARTVAPALTPTPGQDRGHRRGVPGSRPPGGGLLDILTVQEGIRRSADALAEAGRLALGDSTRTRGPAASLAAIPVLAERLDAGPDRLGAQYRTRCDATLDAHRRQARRILGLARDPLWLGPCPCTFTAPVTVVTRAGIVAGDHGCWMVDHAAIVEGLAPAAALALAEAQGWDTRVWQRSRLALPRDGGDRPDVVCWSCGYRQRPEEMADMVLTYLREATPR